MANNSVDCESADNLRTTHEFSSSLPSILHVFVVGFHHKRGCLVEYCYPPINGKQSGITDSDLPEQWQHLPSLALPDGVHNVEKDTVYFLLPSKDVPNQSVYGVSCYRQMSAKDLLCRGDDITRSTVQKSVCVLSRLPLFGSLKAKLELITQAYFNERNFAKVEVLAEMYRNLTVTITGDLVQSHALLGLSVRDLVRRLRHRVLILFKLLLLEKRLLFYLFPVSELCHTILSLVSLFPEAIEHGLSCGSVYIPRVNCTQQEVDCGAGNASSVSCCAAEETVLEAKPPRIPEIEPVIDPDSSLLEEIEAVLLNGEKDKKSPDEPKTPTEVLLASSYTAISTVGQQIGAKFGGWWSGSGGNGKEQRRKDEEVQTKTEIDIASEAEESMESYSSLKTDSWGFPLSIFTKGSLCFPYLSLAYLDCLKGNGVRSYVFGATNALYRQRKDLLDAIVFVDEVGELQLEVLDSDLKKQLSMTTADLRFAEFIMKNVTPDTGNVFIDATGWEGGEEWIRLQFKSYLLSLVASARESEQNLKVDFNEIFIEAWKTTNNYKVWVGGNYPNLRNAVPGHPFAGQLGVSDVRLRVYHSLETSQQGRKLAKAATETGKYVSQTGKAVKSRLSGLFWTDVSDSVTLGKEVSPDFEQETLKNSLTKSTPAS